MLVSEFDYDLPHSLIAQHPLPDRAASRMLVMHRSSGHVEDRWFRDFPDFVQDGDCVVLNNTRVFPARLYGRRNSGPAPIEVLLTRQIAADPDVWEALVRPGRKVRTGEVLLFPGELRAQVLGRGEYGARTLRFSGLTDLLSALEHLGHVPLPPYIRRPDAADDRQRYQTVYARRPGSVAAPTAGLHFTPEVLARLPTVVEITLHVGLGTFQPVRAEAVEEHKMHRETYEITPEAAHTIQAARRVVAIGTTTVRALEHAGRTGTLASGRGETDLFIFPGFPFRVTGALLTNFHLPRSTLLMLVCAFGGREQVLKAYRHAVQEGYRFYSYGDCMLIL